MHNKCAKFHHTRTIINWDISWNIWLPQSLQSLCTIHQRLFTDSVDSRFRKFTAKLVVKWLPGFVNDDTTIKTTTKRIAFANNIENQYAFYQYLKVQLQSCWKGWRKITISNHTHTVKVIANRNKHRLGRNGALLSKCFLCRWWRHTVPPARSAIHSATY